MRFSFRVSHLLHVKLSCIERRNWVTIGVAVPSPPPPWLSPAGGSAANDPDIATRRPLQRSLGAGGCALRSTKSLASPEASRRSATAINLVDERSTCPAIAFPTVDHSRARGVDHGRLTHALWPVG